MSYRQGYSFKDVLRSFVDPNYDPLPTIIANDYKDSPDQELPLPPEDTNPIINTDEVPEQDSDIDMSANVASKDPVSIEHFSTFQMLAAVENDEIETSIDEDIDKIINELKLTEEELTELSKQAMDEGLFDNPIEEDTTKLGAKLINAGLLTHWQRYIVISQQRKLMTRNIDIRFGELVVKLGYCSAKQIQNVLEQQNIEPSSFLGKESNDKNWMGSRLITAGLITPTQRDLLTEEQAQTFKESGKNIRLGDLAIKHGFCTHEQVQTLIDERTQKLTDEDW